MIIPDFIELQAWANKHKLAYNNDLHTLMNTDEVKGLISSEILQTTIHIKSYERPQKWDYSIDAFTQENHMLTAKMSMRRNNIMKEYGSKLNNLYNNNTGILVRTYKTSDVQQMD